jgi:hypothetical protein
MQGGTKIKAEIIDLLEGRREESLEKIRQFIFDADELDYAEFLYYLGPDFAQELDERAAEAKAMLENLRDIEGTLRELDRGNLSPISRFTLPAMEA